MVELYPAHLTSSENEKKENDCTFETDHTMGCQDARRLPHAFVDKQDRKHVSEQLTTWMVFMAPSLSTECATQNVAKIVTTT